MLSSVLGSCKLICFGRKYKFFTLHKNKTKEAEIILSIQLHTRGKAKCFKGLVQTDIML